MSGFHARFRLHPVRRLPALVISAVLCFGTAALDAQEPPSPVQREPLVPEQRVAEEQPSLHGLGRPTTMSPGAGPPGTMVELRGTLLPALTPMQVAFGGSRFGFEALLLTITDEAGNLRVNVRIPDWAATDRSHRFIIFNAYFTGTYAATSPFHVTDSDGKLRRVGEVTWTGAECVSLTTLDEEIYNLVGNLEGLDMGARVAVEGWVVRASEVMERVEEYCPDEGIPLNVAAVYQSEDDG